MDTKRLRQRVLDLAIHGKLVPQNPQDEPASELLKRIAEEKERLVIEGKIKKSQKKDNKDIDEVPFEVPQGWVWTTINDICSKIGSGSTPRGSNYSQEGIPFFRSQNVYNDGLKYDDIKYISEDTHKSMIGTEVHSMDILLNITGGSLGRCALVPEDFNRGNVSQHVCILRPVLLFPKYLHVFIISDYFASRMILSGSGREGLPKYSLEAMRIPLPPLAEQYRIVSEVEKYFSLIDILEESENDLQQSIQKAKSKILDLAIKGKLVEQNEEDEPASILLERIKKENNKNEKKSKIKETVNIDEVPFEVPQGWIWCRLGDIFHLQAGKAIKAEELNNEPNECHQYACYGGNGIRGYINKYSNEGTYCIIGRQGALCGNIKMAEGQFYATEHAVVVYQFGLTDPYWAYYFLTQCNLNQYATATAQPGLSVAIIQDTLISLPPLAEQHRIVARIEELFTQLDNIAEALK